MKMVGYSDRTGHPLEEPISDFIEQNEKWIVEQGGMVSFHMQKRTPGTLATVLVTGADSDEDAAMRQAVNERLIVAGFKTNLPEHDFNTKDSTFLENDPPLTIEIVSWEDRT